MNASDVRLLKIYFNVLRLKMFRGLFVTLQHNVSFHLQCFDVHDISMSGNSHYINCKLILVLDGWNMIFACDGFCVEDALQQIHSSFYKEKEWGGFGNSLKTKKS